jgi:carbon-monoxide dehydrogenase medium subunit
VKPGPFVHHAPTTVDEAVAVLGEVGHDGKVLAGGQSLIPVLSMRLANPGHLVDINGVAGLDAVHVTDTAVRIGALVRHAGLEQHDGAATALPLLRQALRNVAHPAIRNRGTTVGSIAHADPAGEMPSVLVLTDGVLEAVGPGGRREIAATDFFLGPLETTLADDELVEAVRFTRFGPGTRTAFLESSRRHGDYALAGVAVAVDVADGVVVGARAGFVSVTPVPLVLDLTPVLGGGMPGLRCPTRSPMPCASSSTPRATSTPPPTTAGCSPPSSPAAPWRRPPTRHPQPTRHPPPPRSPSHERADDRHAPRAAAEHQPARQRGDAHGIRPRPPPVVGLPAPRPRPHRHPRRLRARRVRGVHGARRRAADARVPDVRRQRATPRGDDDRGHRQRPREPQPGAAGLHRVPRPAVRVLHPRVRHDDHGLPRGQPRPHPRAGPRGDLGQPVPLHGVPEHRVGVCRAAEIRRDRADRTEIDQSVDLGTPDGDGRSRA